MWTKNSDYLSYDDNKMGSVEVGNFVDLLLINHEFLTDTQKYRDCKGRTDDPGRQKGLYCG